jgi:hypothetical protein
MITNKKLKIQDKQMKRGQKEQIVAGEVIFEEEMS